MIFDNVKIDDQFQEIQTGRLIKVIELTEKGFKYSCEPYSTKFGPMQWGTVTGGELYTKDPTTNSCWDFLYRKVNDNES